MSAKSGTTVLREFLQTESGLTEAQAVKLSGADLERAAMIVKAGNPANSGLLSAANLSLLGGKLTFPR